MKQSILLFFFLGHGILAFAQITPYTERFFLNFELNRQTLSLDEDNMNSDHGGGIGLKVGYGFTPTFSMYVGFSGARMRDGNVDGYGLGIAEWGTRLHFGRKLKSPTFYLDIAFQGVATKVDAPDISLSGGGLGLGGGLLVFVGQELALDFGLRGSAGRFNQFEIDGSTVVIDEDNIQYGVGRLSVGITWFPSAN